LYKIATFHSFRRGTGRTNLLACLAILLARQGKRVGIIDTNLQSPSAHILFKLPYAEITHTLDNYLWEECELEQVIYDIGKYVGFENDLLYLVPSSDDMLRIMRILKDGFEISQLITAYSQFAKSRDLDYLFIDSSSGLNEDILLSMSVTDILVIVMRLDEQDYQGVGMTLDIAKRLNLSRNLVIVNNTPKGYDQKSVETQLSKSFECEIGAVLPHSEDFLTLASKNIFVLEYPEHPVTMLLEDLAKKL